MYQSLQHISSTTCSLIILSALSSLLNTAYGLPLEPINIQNSPALDVKREAHSRGSFTHPGDIGPFYILVMPVEVNPCGAVDMAAMADVPQSRMGGVGERVTTLGVKSRSIELGEDVVVASVGGPSRASEGSGQAGGPELMTATVSTTATAVSRTPGAVTDLYNECPATSSVRTSEWSATFDRPSPTADVSRSRPSAAFGPPKPTVCSLGVPETFTVSNTALQDKSFFASTEETLPYDTINSLATYHATTEPSMIFNAPMTTAATLKIQGPFAANGIPKATAALSRTTKSLKAFDAFDAPLLTMISLSGSESETTTPRTAVACTTAKATSRIFSGNENEDLTIDVTAISYQRISSSQVSASDNRSSASQASRKILPEINTSRENNVDITMISGVSSGYTPQLSSFKGDTRPTSSPQSRESHTAEELSESISKTTSRTSQDSETSFSSQTACQWPKNSGVVCNSYQPDPNAGKFDKPSLKPINPSKGPTIFDDFTGEPIS
ncbi:hypothetical protein MMC06_001765 [Schaereria dolodes]|nr:hypothetical protein [Schaereria dolodes]